MENASNNSELAGHLHIRINSSGVGKLKSLKRYHWFIIDKKTNQLCGYKNSKDIGNKDPIESLPLFGAGVSFGNTDENEFIINIRGTEYRLNAENHKMLMKWTNTLQELVKRKPEVTADATKLESVPENEPLTIEQSRHGIETKPKRKSLFQRIFSRKSKSIVKANDKSNFSDGDRVVRAAPLRSVVGSMQDISTKPENCSNCQLLQGHNSYLTRQVSQLNQDVENVKQQLRVNVRSYNTIEVESIKLRKNFIVFIQRSLMQDENTYNKLADIPASKEVIQLVKKEKEINNNLPEFNSEGKMELHKDYLGFIHGTRDTSMQVLLYLCDVLKRKYDSHLQENNDIYQQWQTYIVSVTTESTIIFDNNLKELIRHGIPHDLRGKLWTMLIEKHVKSIKEEKGDNYYKHLVSKLPDLQGDEEDNDGSIEKQIKIDLMRTMPTHKDFQNLEKGKIPVLHRILRAYLLHNPEIGYCQGMNFMVGFALLYLDEEGSFWLLVAVMEIFFSSHHYNMYLSGTQANQKVMDEIARQELPGMLERLDKLFCELSPVTFNWFMTIFIDSMPVEIVFVIWDWFLVFGHGILYKIALSLLRLRKNSIMKAADALSTMRKLKMLGRSFHDLETLSEAVFDGSFKHTSEEYLEMYQKYLVKIEEESRRRQLEDEEYEKRKQKLKFTPKQMTVSISDNLDTLDDDMIIKCAACEANRNFVWLLCSSDLAGQLFVLNVASKNIELVDWQIDCKCLSMASLSNSGIMLISTIKSTLHAIDTEKKHELWKMQLAGSVLHISCDSLGNVGLALMDGSIALLNIKGKEFHQTIPTYVDISRSPVFCGCIINDHFWCGAANKIVILDINTLEMRTSLRVCPNTRHTVSQLVSSNHGVWASVQGSSVLHLWDQQKHVCLLTVDILDECNLSSEKKSGNALASSVTTMLALKNKLWVGFGNGRFIICDIFQEANSEDDLNEAIHLFKSTENLAVAQTKAKLGVSTCCHAITGDSPVKEAEEYPLQQHVDGSTDFVMVEKRSSMMEGDSSVRISLKMNQIQRVCEETVNCFVPCRQDGKLILSGMGGLNNDSSVILWSSEKRDGREMWFAQTVSHSE